MTVVTRGGHVPGIWDVSGNLCRVGALESQGRAAFHQKAYPAKAWWVTGAEWEGFSPNLALADSLQLYGTLGTFSAFTRHRNPHPPCYPTPSAVCLLSSTWSVLLNHWWSGLTRARALSSPATNCSAMCLGRRPTSSSAHWEQNQHLALSAASFLC